MADLSMKGYIQVYTGNGKGKTTAALGLAVRAAGAGLNVYILQFLKKGDYSEIKALRKLSDHISIEQFGSGTFIKGKPCENDVAEALKGFTKAREIIQSGKFDIVILEEANIAIQYNLFSENELIELLKEKPAGVEIVITGRYATDKIIEIADLVTEMKEIKHYYTNGVHARTGIEK
jgi:cob(I)alamin adenosyltransferase